MRKKISVEEKLDAVRRRLDEHISSEQIAEEIGVHESTVRLCRRVLRLQQ